MRTIETIAVDLDDVVAQHAVKVCELANEVHGTSLTVADYSEDWQTMWGITSEEAEELRSAIMSPERVKTFEPEPGAADGLLKLALSGRELVGLTKRRTTLAEATEEWVSQHFPNVFSDIIHATYFDSLGNKIVRGKEEICLEIGASSLIDDQLAACRAVALLGITGVLYNRHGWYEGLELPNLVVAAHNWQEVWDNFNERS